MKIGQERLIALQELENGLGFFFTDKTYLHQALTHSSYAHQHKIMSNERLEFLGDSVLDLIIAERLFSRYPHSNEGFLTKARASLVNQNVLSQLAIKFKLSQYLLVGESMSDEKANNPAVLSDTFEAVLGAIYLQLGYTKTASWLDPYIQEFWEKIHTGDLDTDYKSSLQVFMQRKYKELPVYQLTSVQGPEHNQRMFVQVFLKGDLYGQGEGRNKKEAQQMAARAALKKLKEEGLYV